MFGFLGIALETSSYGTNHRSMQASRISRNMPMPFDLPGCWVRQHRTVFWRAHSRQACWRLHRPPAADRIYERLPFLPFFNVGAKKSMERRKALGGDLAQGCRLKAAGASIFETPVLIAGIQNVFDHRKNQRFIILALAKWCSSAPQSLFLFHLLGGKDIGIELLLGRKVPENHCFGYTAAAAMAFVVVFSNPRSENNSFAILSSWLRALRP